MTNRWTAVLCLVGCVLIAGCSRSKNEVIQDLQRLNLKFTTEDYVRSAGLGDMKALGLFLEAGIDPNALNSDGITALIAAAAHGRMAAVKFLLDHNADPNAAGKSGQTPLMAAAENNHADILQWLLDRRANPAAKDHNGWTALLKAVYRNNVTCVQLLAERDRQGLGRGLLVASLLGFKDAVKTLLDNGAEADARSEDRRTPLMLAASKGNKEIVKMLLDAGADPALTDRTGETAESLANAQGFAEVTTMLRDAPPLAADQKPKTSPAQGNNNNTQAVASNEIADIADQELLSEAGPGRSPGRLANGSPAGNTPGGRPSLRNVVTVTEIHENFLPVTLTDVQGRKAHLRSRDGGQFTVSVGDQLPGLNYEVIGVETRNVSDKDGNPVDASRVKLRQATTGETLSLIKGIPAREKGSFVTLRFPPQGETIQVGLDQEFKIPDDPAHTYKVIDIRPEQVIVRRVEDGQVWTLERSVER
ncbi:MAG: ankyrin repeat domain-containing protein [Verrucomicrobia bacterium]|nr:ankyrin repeat domain-containing protein [Verrucomicrobiota bacterium]